VDLTFDQIVVDAATLAARLKSADVRADFIVGVTRGGWIPARLLSAELGVKRLLSIGLTYADETRSDLVAYQLPQPMPAGKRLLVVEDCLESGFSLHKAKQISCEAGNTVTTASLYITRKTCFKPDFFQTTYDVPPAFPWE